MLYSVPATYAPEAAAAPAPALAPARRFAPRAGFLSGASFVEVSPDACALVWGNGTRVPWPDVTLPRALRLVARGTWVELPPTRARTSPKFADAPGYTSATGMA